MPTIRTCWTAALAAAVCAVALPSRAASQGAAPPAPASATLAPNAQAEAYLDAVRKGDAAAVQRALDAGVPVDTPFRYNRTALSFAADRGHVEVVRLLLAKGANPDTPDSFYNQTALGWAAQPAQARKPEHVEVVKLLLGKGAKGKERALGAAIGADDAPMVQVIVESGGLSPSLLSESLASARKGGKTAVAAALEKAGATMPVVATLTAAQLARYPGTYNDGRADIVLSVKEGSVVAAVGPQTFTLSPRSETTFVVEGLSGTTATIALESDKAVSLTVVNQGGQSTVYKRVNP